MQKPGDLPGRRQQLLNAREKVFRPPWEFSSQKKIPSPACRLSVAERSTGFCLFSSRVNSSLCVISVALCVSVVIFSHNSFTTETQRATELAQRDAPGVDLCR